MILPLLCGVGVGAATWWLLSVDTAPVRPPALGFDLPHNPKLEDLAFRLFGAYGRPGARDEFRPAQNVDVSIEATSCDPWVDVRVSAYLDNRWWMAFKSSAQHTRFEAPLALRETFSSAKPGVTGEFAFAVNGQIRDLSATTRGDTFAVPLRVDAERTRGGLNVVRGTIPSGVLERTAINEFLAPSVHFAFSARWIHKRSYGTCWLTMPQLVGQSAALLALGPIDGMTGRSSFDEGPLAGRTSLQTRQAAVLRDRTEPSPVYSQGPAWTCSSRRKRDNELADPPNCSAAVVIQQDGAERRSQWLLLFCSGLLSAAVVGSVAGLRRMILEGGQ